MELWSHHSQGLVRHDHYDALGALSGALARRADSRHSRSSTSCQGDLPAPLHAACPRWPAGPERAGYAPARAFEGCRCRYGAGVIRSLTDARLLVTDRDVTEPARKRSRPRTNARCAAGRVYANGSRRTAASCSGASSSTKVSSTGSGISPMRAPCSRARDWRSPRIGSRRRANSLNDEEVAFIERKLPRQVHRGEPAPNAEARKPRPPAGGIAHDFNNLLVAILGTPMSLSKNCQ